MFTYVIFYENGDKQYIRATSPKQAWEYGEKINPVLRIWWVK